MERIMIVGTAAAVLTLASAAPIQAATWNGSVSTAWSNTDNWNGGSVWGGTNDASADKIAAANLTLGANSILDLLAVAPIFNNPYTIATYSGSLTGTFSNALPAGWQIDYGTGSGSAITVTLIPEPASLALLAAGGLLLLPRRKREC